MPQEFKACPVMCMEQLGHIQKQFIYLWLGSLHSRRFFDWAPTQTPFVYYGSSLVLVYQIRIQISMCAPIFIPVYLVHELLCESLSTASKRGGG